MNIHTIVTEVRSGIEMLSAAENRATFKRNLKEIVATPEGRAFLKGSAKKAVAARINPLTLEQYVIMSAAYPAVILSDRAIREEGFWKAVMPHTTVPATLRTMARHPGWTSAYFASCVVVGALRAKRLQREREAEASEGYSEFDTLTHDEQVEIHVRKHKMMLALVAETRLSSARIRDLIDLPADEFAAKAEDIRDVMVQEERLGTYIKALRTQVDAYDVVEVEATLEDMYADEDDVIRNIGSNLMVIWG